MISTHNPGRVAGFWYLLLVVIGPLRLIDIPSRLFVKGNATGELLPQYQCKVFLYFQPAFFG